MNTLVAPRRVAQPEAAHAIRLGGLGARRSADAAAPLLLERRDQNFVEGLLEDLAASDDAATLARVLAQKPAAQNGLPRLFPPVQRVFNLAVCEAWCVQPGMPRLDARKIESAGLVLRRVAGNAKLAWVKAGTRVHGWEPVDEDLDPQADRRAAAVSLGNAALDASLLANRLRRAGGVQRWRESGEAVTESVAPLFVAPPEVCARAGRTLLFGNLPLVSSEQVEPESTTPVKRYGSDAAERAQLRAHLPRLLRAGHGDTLPLAGQRLDRDRSLGSAPGLEADGVASLAAFDEFLLLLRQLRMEFDAFGDSAAAKALYGQLQGIEVEYGVRRRRRAPAGLFLKHATRVLIDGEEGRVRMPHRWGAVSAARADAIFEAVLSGLDQQFAQLGLGRGRFDAPGRGDQEPRYVVRAFIRLKPDHAGCPARLLWSPYSEPFTIAPWYESAGQPPQLVPMPDLFDRGLLKKMKPGVAFALPPKLAKLLQGKPEDLMKGDGDGGNGLGLGWICSFSIPVITLCAFIVLNIFLTLFNLIFFWLPFLKICIPIPKKGTTP